MALLKQARPTWGPDAIKSALMTTARQNLIREEDGNPATPLDMGSGFAQPALALNPGVAYLTSSMEYEAMACGLGPEFLDGGGGRCAELAALGYSFDIKNINFPTISVGYLESSVNITRTLTNMMEDGSCVKLSANLEADDFGMTVSPCTMTIAPDQSMDYSVMIERKTPREDWFFGSITWYGEPVNCTSTGRALGEDVREPPSSLAKTVNTERDLSATTPTVCHTARPRRLGTSQEEKQSRNLRVVNITKSSTNATATSTKAPTATKAPTTTTKAPTATKAPSATKSAKSPKSAKARQFTVYTPVAVFAVN